MSAGGEVGSLGLEISHELVETLPAGDVQPTPAMVGIVLDDLMLWAAAYSRMI